MRILRPALLITLILMPQFAIGELLVNEYLASNDSGLLDEDGDREDWIELFNDGGSDLEIGGYWLSDDVDLPRKWELPEMLLPAGAFLIVYASGKADSLHPLHSNFKISAVGEILIIGDPEGRVLDLIETGPMPTDMSRGRVPDGGPDWFLFTDPSPGAGNDSTPYGGFAEEPSFTPASGVYGEPVVVSLGSGTPEAVIRYALGGTEVDESSALYAAPIPLDSTTVIRARTYAQGYLPSEESFASFLLGETSELPKLSLITDPPNFFDIDFGIYAFGPFACDWPHYCANFWNDWERPVHLELFEPNGAQAFAVPAGAKIHGGWSRGYDQKSLRIILRETYGPERIEYPIFPGNPVDSFHIFILRNTGSDWQRAFIRDGFGHRLAEGTGLDVLGYRPSLLFINGEYWGIHNMRERADVWTLASHHGVDPVDIDLLEGDAEALEGNNILYSQMMQFITDNDPADAAVFADLRERMVMENFAEYMIHEIYLGNTDWPGKNIRYWRPRRQEAKWRWILTDLDIALGRSAGPEHDTLQFATEEDNPGAANPLWATLLLRRLLRSDDFRIDFINRFADRMNAGLRPDAMNALLDELTAVIEPELSRQVDRWGSPANWQTHIDIVRDFIDARPDYMRGHIMQKFGLADTLHLSLAADPPGSGSVALTAITVDGDWTGTYYTGLPITLRAEPAPGHHFTGWSDLALPQTESITVEPDGDYAVTARFATGGGYPGLVLFNEINFNAAPGNNAGDWVELHNPGGDAVDLSGWIFKDGDDTHAFEIPPDTQLPGGGYLVLCRSLSSFRGAYPLTPNAVGDFVFGLGSSGESLRLFDDDDNYVDAVRYGVDAPWPLAANGGGPSLELISPALDNALAESWAAATTPGTPGAGNGIYQPVAIPEFSATASANPATVLIDARFVSVGTPPEFRIEASGNGREWTLGQVEFFGDLISTEDADPLLRYGGEITYALLARKLGEESWRPVGTAAVTLAAQLPLPNLLERPFPNPFNGVTSVRFSLAAAGRARVSVHDVRGRRVALLADGPFARGFHNLYWDGRDSEGRPLSSGIYLLRVQAGNFKTGRKLAILR